MRLEQQLEGLQLEDAARAAGLHLLAQRHLLVISGMRPVLQEP